jgi:ketosteroid isomerase-like protein
MKINSETVSKIYEAFGKGDVQAIVSHLADDVRWEEWPDNSAQKAGVPWLKTGKGKGSVLDFLKLMGEMKFNYFEVKSLMEGPGQVAAEVAIEMEIPSSGATIRDEEIHLWTFNDAGKVVRMRHYLDTAKHMLAAKV